MSSELPFEPKSLDVALNTAGVEGICSEDARLLSTVNAIRFEFWVKGGLGGNLCSLWLMILKSVWYSTGDNLNR